MTYTLKAMQHGSKAATQQFPRLLQLVELYPETMDKFKSKVEDLNVDIRKSGYHNYYIHVSQKHTQSCMNEAT